MKWKNQTESYEGEQCLSVWFTLKLGFGLHTRPIPTEPTAKTLSPISASLTALNTHRFFPSHCHFFSFFFLCGSYIFFAHIQLNTIGKEKGRRKRDRENIVYKYSRTVTKIEKNYISLPLSVAWKIWVFIIWTRRNIIYHKAIFFFRFSTLRVYFVLISWLLWTCCIFRLACRLICAFDQLSIPMLALMYSRSGLNLILLIVFLQYCVWYDIDMVLVLQWYMEFKVNWKTN